MKLSVAESHSPDERLSTELVAEVLVVQHQLRPKLEPIHRLAVDHCECREKMSIKKSLEVVEKIELCCLKGLQS